MIRSVVECVQDSQHMLIAISMKVRSEYMYLALTVVTSLCYCILLDVQE